MLFFTTGNKKTLTFLIIYSYELLKSSLKTLEKSEMLEIETLLNIDIYNLNNAYF